MRPPWIEASALLGAAGLRHSRDGGNATPAHLLKRTLLMTRAKYAFASRIDLAVEPATFRDLAALADHVERLRHGQGVHLIEVDDLQLIGDARPRKGVQVMSLMLDGSHDRCLGYAWLNGGGRERLQHALVAAGHRAGGARTATRATFVSARRRRAA